MSLSLKPLEQQVIVITGASSGIGLATARMAAERGARVVLCARNEDELRKETERLNARGRDVASYFVADTADQEQVNALARHAIETFGRIDTWVNNAAAPIYGELAEIPAEDHRRVFDVNYFGVVYGSLAAVEHMHQGGAIINLGSVLSEIPMPLQGPYVASKHAVKGFTDTLRIELQTKGLPIAVSLIKPSAIDTPYPDHARLYIDNAPVTPPPRYAPELVARTTLYCAEHETREIYVGGAGRALVAVQKIFPGLYDWSARNAGFAAQKTDLPAAAPRDARDNLYEPRSDGSERGKVASHSAGQPWETSLYTEMQMRNWASTLVTAVAVAGAGLALMQLMPRRTRARMDPRRYLPSRDMVAGMIPSRQQVAEMIPSRADIEQTVPGARELRRMGRRAYRTAMSRRG